MGDESQNAVKTQSLDCHISDDCPCCDNGENEHLKN